MQDAGLFSEELQDAITLGLGVLVGGVRVIVGLFWHLLDEQYVLKHWPFEVHEQPSPLL